MNPGSALADHVERAVDERIGRAVERHAEALPDGGVRAEIRRGARAVVVESAGGLWRVTRYPAAPAAAATPGKLVTTLEEALDLAARLLVPAGAPEPSSAAAARRAAARDAVPGGPAVSRTAAVRPIPRGRRAPGC